MAPKGGTVCAYRACSSRTSFKSKSLFGFPKDVVRAEHWLRASGREDLLTKPLESLNKNYKLCELHFESKWFSQSTDTRKRLLDQAIPTVFEHRKCTFSPMKTLLEEPQQKVIILSDVTIAPATAKPKSIPSFTTTQRIAEPLDIGTENIPPVAPVPTHSKGDLVSQASTQTAAILNSSTPRKKNLRAQVKRLRRQQLVQSSFRDDKEGTLEDFNVMCDKFLNKPFAEIVKMQAQLKDKSPLGRRYTLQCKQHALMIYFLGRQAYKYISKILMLPSKRCLEQLASTLVYTPGLNNNVVFTTINLKIQSLSDQDKHCIICIDEMAIKGNLYYHTGRDEIVGIEDTGKTKRNLIAQNASVIMIRGIYSNWKQPLAYFFINSNFKAIHLCSVIEECILKLSNIGLHVNALITDMGSNFIELSRMLGVTPENPIFTSNNREVIYLFDTCHLIKATRNNLITNSFCYENQKTSWSFIEQFYNKEQKQTYRCAPKLTHGHIYPTNFQKMKVKLAAQLLSNTVASAMNTYVSVGALPEEAMGTIEIIAKFDKLFDVLNSSNRNSKNKYKNVFEGAEYQITLLNEMIHYLKNLKLLNKNGDDVTSRSKFRTAWIITIKGILCLWEKLQQVGFKYLQTRRLNQDCLENFFGSIRQQGGNCINPTPIQFERAFKKLFTQNYFQSGNANCMNDQDRVLITLNSTSNLNVTTAEEGSYIYKAIAIDDYSYRSEELPVQNAFNYVCGYLMKKCLNKHSCSVCRDYSKAVEELDYAKLLIHFKAFDTEKSIYGGLRVPSELFVKYIYKLEQIFVTQLEDIWTKGQISHTYLSMMRQITRPDICSNFAYDYLLKLFIRLRIFYTLKYVNRNLRTSCSSKKNRKIEILSHI